MHHTILLIASSFGVCVCVCVEKRILVSFINQRFQVPNPHAAILVTTQS